jgi:BirA family biotin operon repressor/biotin-[acetyl-CoA-carboxylase] ligase
MSEFEATDVRRPLTELTNAKLDKLEAFSSIASTSTYLLTQPAPAPGRFRVAIADHQTSGRGRHSRRWISPPESGLYLSLAYTFAEMPEHLPGLTLALGVAVVDALTILGVEGVSLKWPNDIVAQDCKLGGILTEVQSAASEGVTVVIGIGLNMHLREQIDFGAESVWAHRAVDLNAITDELPPRDLLAGTIIECVYASCVRFGALGFEEFAEEWRQQDWLMGREITVDMPDRQITGIAAGVDRDGALIVDNDTGKTRIISGSIVMAGLTEFGQ